MRFTEEEWQALCALRHIDGAKRQATPSTQALRSVLVDGVPPTEAAKAHGLTHQAVYHSLSRSRDVQALARELAGAADIQSERQEMTDKTDKTGGPAFPQGKGVGETWVFEGGVTMRDAFAIAALQGLLANPGGPIQANSMNGWSWCNFTAEDVASLTYSMADAMLKERSK